MTQKHSNEELLELAMLRHARRNAEELLHSMEDFNSEYPETKKFLESKGLTHVSQLDKQGQKELAEYLQKVFEFIKKN